MNNRTIASIFNACLVLLLFSASEAQESSLPELEENFARSGSARDGELLFKHCAAFNNALLNGYKDNSNKDIESAEAIEKYSLITAKHVDIASLFTLGVSRQGLSAALASPGNSIQELLNESNGIFDETYYGLLSYYTNVLQNASLRTVEVGPGVSAFVSSLNELVDSCDRALSMFCDLDSLFNCTI